MKRKNFWNSYKICRAPDDGAGQAPAANPAVEPAATTQTPAQPATTQPAAPDLSFIGADFRNDAGLDTDKFRQHYEGLVAADARHAERAALIPENGAYDLTLGDMDFGDLALPEGFAVALDLENPAVQPVVGELTALLRDVGATQGEASKLVGIYAKIEAARVAEGYQQRSAELAALGTPAQQQARLGEVTRLLAARLPADQAQAITGGISSAKGVLALEALLSPRSMRPPAAEPTAQKVPEGASGFERLRHINRNNPNPQQRNR